MDDGEREKEFENGARTDLGRRQKEFGKGVRKDLGEKSKGVERKYCLIGLKGREDFRKEV